MFDQVGWELATSATTMGDRVFSSHSCFIRELVCDEVVDVGREVQNGLDPFGKRLRRSHRVNEKQRPAIDVDCHAVGDTVEDEDRVAVLLAPRGSIPPIHRFDCTVTHQVQVAVDVLAVVFPVPPASEGSVVLRLVGLLNHS